MQDQRTLQRLRWQCRRGMLELDLLLLAYVDKAAVNLDSQQLALFERLLNRPDQIIYDWLFKHQIPTDKEVSQLVDEIRACVTG